MVGRCLKRSCWHVFAVTALPSCPSAISSQRVSPAWKTPPQRSSQGRGGVAVSSPRRNASLVFWISKLQPWQGPAEPLEAAWVLEALVLHTEAVFVHLAGVVLLSADF